MKVLWKAAASATLIAATLILGGCGDVFRPIATPSACTVGQNCPGNPSGAETEVVLNQCPTGATCLDYAGTPSASVITAIDVSGDTNVGNKALQNQVGSVAGPVAGSMASPLAFDASRTVVYTANTSTDSVTQLSLSSSTATAGFSANTTTLTLPAGAAPTSISFQYFGVPYTQEYVVNSGPTSVCPAGGSLGVISQATSTLKATVCLGTNAKPVAAWIYAPDQSKVFVLDHDASLVYVVNAGKAQLTNVIALPAGSGPFQFAQSNNGLFLYTLNGNGSISIIDGQAETVVSTISTSNPATSALPVDIAQDPNFNDTSANAQVNHIWVLHADGTVSVWDGTTNGGEQLSWITSIPTISPATLTSAQLAANPYPTNLALLRDGTWAYVGIGNTDQIVAINSSKLANGAITQGATTSITVGAHRSVSETLANNINPASPIAATVPVEVTTPTVTSVAVSRQGNSADLSKVYATTTTTTTYYCYDENVAPTDCANPDPWVNGTPITALPPATPFLVSGCTNLNTPVEQNAMSCPNLYNGTTVVTAAANGTTPVNTLITTLSAPSVVTYCDPGNPATGEYDGQKNCPAMIPAMVLGRN